jgi:hypothetical protein
MIDFPVVLLVRVAELFPDGFRPGVFCAEIVTIAWALHNYGIAAWHVTCRSVAWTVDAAIGVLVLPDFLFSSYLRKHQARPPYLLVLSGNVTERMLDGLATFYGQHDKALTKKRQVSAYPWTVSAVLLAIPLVSWLILDQTTDKSAAFQQHQLHVWSYWTKLQTWADS